VIPNQIRYRIENGTTLNAYRGSEIHAPLSIFDGTLNLLGAELSQPIHAENGSFVNIDAGSLAGFRGSTFSNGSTVTVRGGQFNDKLVKLPDASLTFEGVDFKFNGIAILGLSTPGDEVSVEIPDESLFTGILANGAPFTFESQRSSFNGTVRLRQTERPTGPAVVDVRTDDIPQGALPGQTLNVLEGAELPRAFNAAPGSVVNVEGGRAFDFELYDSELNVNAGLIGNIRSYGNSNIRVNGGEVQQISPSDNLNLVVSGGEIGVLYASPGNEIGIDGGTIEYLRIRQRGAEVALSGGTIRHETRLDPGTNLHVSGGVIESSLFVPEESRVTISGGRIAESDLRAISTMPGSELSIHAKSFSLGGQAIPGLNNPGDTVVLVERPDQFLDATLADGRPFQLYVGTVFPQLPVLDKISPESTLRLTLAPESPPGDFNLDGQVDAADFTLWRDTLGQTGPNLATDGNGDNVVDELDYQLWQTGFDQATASAQLATTVPEPAAVVYALLIAGMAILCSRLPVRK